MTIHQSQEYNQQYFETIYGLFSKTPMGKEEAKDFRKKFLQSAIAAVVVVAFEMWLKQKTMALVFAILSVVTIFALYLIKKMKSKQILEKTMKERFERGIDIHITDKKITSRANRRIMHYTWNQVTDIVDNAQGIVLCTNDKQFVCLRKEELSEEAIAWILGHRK